ncbi:MAG: prepilin-type N-terminal cleavage/methylation domain-containing protein [Acidobacteria bacterium]|nr:prepilin-type N-terminal cleavage/methylation domain-containing protein [Acidobacteriota bacterium]
MRENAFTLVELLAAIAIVMILSVVMAGAGSYRSAMKGSLNTVLAPIVPYRLGTTTPDPQAGTFFRSDAMTVMYITSDAPDTSLAVAMSSPTSAITLAADSSCSPGAAVCGFATGDRVLIYNDSGGFDTFTITGTTPASNIIQHASDTLSRAYGAGSRVARITMRTFSLLTNTSTSTYQLVQFDGYQNELPLVDNVVALRFDYFGEPAVPELTADPSALDGPWTTYGPKPPVIGTDNTADSWPAGENCTFKVLSGSQVSRLSSLGTMTLVPLSQAMLTDGPWCPDQTSPNRYDADLLRVRKVRVTLRVQTGQSALRGAAGTLFTRAGLAKEGSRLVPDQEVVFDVAPRNLNLAR